MKAVTKIIFLCMMLSLTGCRHKLHSGEYIAYVEDTAKGLRHIVRAGSCEFVFQYRPSNYMLLMENKLNFGDQALKKRKENLDKSIWFSITLKIKDKNVSPLRYNLASKQEYEDRINYYLNMAVKDIALIHDGKDTLRPAGYVFENNYNLIPQETILVGFDKPSAGKLKNLQLVFYDAIFKNGIVKAKYTDEDLNKIPDLSY